MQRVLGKPIFFFLVLSAAVLNGCGKGKSYPPPDFSSPQKALESIENAYRQGDKNAILACKDFALEAKFIVPDDMSKMGKQGNSPAEKIAEMRKMNMVLLQAKYKQDLAAGIPEWKGVKAEIVGIEKLTEDMVIVTEKLTLPTDPVETLESRMFVGRNEQGQWKALMEYSPKMAENWRKYYGS